MNESIPLKLVDGDEGTLYARQPKVYPREIKGRFQRLRNAAVLWLLGMFYVFPWLNWDGRQMVLFDLPHRKFYILGLTFWPQDFFFMAWLLIMAGLSLFFFTALAGRLWCGYACPQTVWTEAFLWIERKIEGDRNQRMRLDKASWSAAKLTRKGLKQLAWIAFALWTGFTFVGFFTPIRELAGEVAHFDLGGWEMFWIAFYGFATYGNAGFLREQVCKYMCPYARFQGAMFDRDTLIISYDEPRGEDRGHRKRGTPSVLAWTDKDGERPALGDCIDCQACVQVCPTGIDIRHGLQVGCIACAACIDACDAVMDKMDYPRGLIRYTTEHAMEGKPSRVLRVRTLLYATVLLILAGAFAWSIGHRSMLLAEVLRDRNALWRVGPAGSIENSYTLKLVNKSDRPMTLTLSLRGDTPLAVIGSERLDIAAGEVASVPVTLRAPAGSVHGRQRVTLQVRTADPQSATHPAADVTTAFFAPSTP
ncbi:cytochrome c oxidase accessory protein CcoG [Oleiagrimonas soli]|uniref:Cytochrome c oxidase accessory protein FixG n=1 Tax=Oleiagrimonas soli TaxID=1543381 RepID=A0A841KF44_9GAMM|nr:cytochrome c oxidase accessory protein CcoG [Oleiagrimonas soli]MBB6183786.1 cytochrome c oxidase accessory protein FixG [Oleiagrimonas soli]